MIAEDLERKMAALHAKRIIAGHYTVFKEGLTYDIKRKIHKVGKGVKVGKGTPIDHWYIYQGETYIAWRLTLGGAKDFLLQYSPPLKIHPDFQARLDSLLPLKSEGIGERE